jgi:hypothetical protein
VAPDMQHELIPGWASGDPPLPFPCSYQHVFDELEQLTFCKYKARPHWGKNSNRAFANERCPVRRRHRRSLGCYT